MGEVAGVVGLIVHHRHWWRWWCNSHEVVVRQPGRDWVVELEVVRQDVLLLTITANTKARPWPRRVVHLLQLW